MKTGGKWRLKKDKTEDGNKWQWMDMKTSIGRLLHSASHIHRFTTQNISPTPQKLESYIGIGKLVNWWCLSAVVIGVKTIMARAMKTMWKEILEL